MIDAIASDYKLLRNIPAQNDDGLVPSFHPELCSSQPSHPLALRL